MVLSNLYLPMCGSSPARDLPVTRADDEEADIPAFLCSPPLPRKEEPPACCL